MYVIVVGGGKVGYYLTKELLAAGHELVMRQHRYSHRIAQVLQILRAGARMDPTALLVAPRHSQGVIGASGD